MSLFITSLNSGSNGNCYYIGNQNEAVLVDAGISCREIEKRMLRLGLQIKKVKAIFISHEHSDHIKGLSVLTKKYQLPVYLSSETLKNLSCVVDKSLIRICKGFEEIPIGNLTGTAFAKIHDASDPHSFFISCDQINIGVFTDLGAVCQNLITYFKKCHAAFLEANYDVELLDSGRYPYYLKNRIRGGKGHLSNHEALELFNTHKSPHMSHLLLSHLSKDNNCPELVQTLFRQDAGNTEIIVASRYKETAVYFITETDHLNSQPDNLLKAEPFQLSLF